MDNNYILPHVQPKENFKLFDIERVVYEDLENEEFLLYSLEIRMGNIMKKHSRKVYTFLNALGSAGGLLGLFTKWIGTFAAPFAMYQFFIISLGKVFPKLLGSLMHGPISRTDLLRLRWTLFIH